MTERNKTDRSRHLCFDHAPHQTFERIGRCDPPMMGSDREHRRISDSAPGSAPGERHLQIEQKLQQCFAHPCVFEREFAALAARREPGIQSQESLAVVMLQCAGHAPEQRAIEHGVGVFERSQYPFARAGLVDDNARGDGRFQTAGIGERSHGQAQASQTQQVKRHYSGAVVINHMPSLI